MNRNQLKLSTSTDIRINWIAYWFFLISVTLWCFLIIAAPILASLKHKFLSGIIYLFFSKVCHQIPERSFFLVGKQLGVCMRCTGIYFGFFLGTIIYPVVHRFRPDWIPSAKLFFIVLLPISVDYLMNIFRIAQNTSISRSVTGFILGVMAVYFVLPGIFAFANNLKYSKQMKKWEQVDARKTR